MTFFTAKRVLQRHKWRLVAIFLIIFSYLFTNNIYANQIQTFEKNETIRELVTHFLEEISQAADTPTIEVNVNKLDSRLKLRLCENNLTTSLPNGSKVRGKIMVEVQCDHPVSWKVLIPGNIDEYVNVVVAKRPLSRKSIIVHDDVMMKRINLSSFRKQPVRTTQQIIGSSTKRRISTGSIIFEDIICLVCRGESVQITAKNKFININLEGIALSDATLGERALVKNKQTKRSFNATVIGRNQLEVLIKTTN